MHGSNVQYMVVVMGRGYMISVTCCATMPGSPHVHSSLLQGSLAGGRVRRGHRGIGRLQRRIGHLDVGEVVLTDGVEGEGVCVVVDELSAAEFISKGKV